MMYDKLAKLISTSSRMTRDEKKTDLARDEYDWA